MAKELSEEQIYEEARRRVKEKKGFWGNFSSWAAVNVILIIIWALTDLGGYPWFLWPLGIWVSLSCSITCVSLSLNGNQIERQ